MHPIKSPITCLIILNITYTSNLYLYNLLINNTLKQTLFDLIYIGEGHLQHVKCHGPSQAKILFTSYMYFVFVAVVFAWINWIIKKKYIYIYI